MSKTAAGFAAACPLLVLAPICWLLYAAFPLGTFKMFALADQLGEGELDTGGLAFDEVTAKTGFDMGRYESSAPRLPARGLTT